MTWRTELRRLVIVAAACLIGAGTVVAGTDCRQDQFEGIPVTICEVDPATEDLRLWWAGEDGLPYGTFTRLRDAIEREGGELGFAMNAGMFHGDRSPVGLYRERGVQEQGIVTSAGPGNFGMLPNGVFCIGNGQAAVIESRAFAADPPDCAFATQSGPMLVIDGALHPRFIPDSASRFLRNGVGVREDGVVVAAISDRPINFDTFARLFRDKLGTPNALYLDGKVSRLYAPDLGRDDAGLPVGPMLGTVRRSD